MRPGDRIVIRHHLKHRHSRFTPCHTQCPVDVNDLQPFRCTHISRDGQDKEYQVCDSWVDSQTAHMVESKTAWKGKTVFSIKSHVDLSSFASGSNHEVQMMQWSPKQHRQLIQQIQEGSKPSVEKKDS